MNFFKKNKTKGLIKKLKTVPSPQKIGLEMITENLKVIRREIFENLNQLSEPEARQHTLELLDETLDILDNGTTEEKVALVTSSEFAAWIGLKPLRTKK